MRTIISTIVVLSLVAAACGSDTSTSPTTVRQPVSTESTTPSESAVTTAPTLPPDATGARIADGWALTRIGSGIKPVLALDASDLPAIAWLVEEVEEGFVSYAAAANGWAEDRFVEGYFYGPIGLDFDPAGNPHVVYHDHQATTFQDDLGDLTHAVLAGGSWEVQAAVDDGHDGWDSTVVVGADGIVRAAGVDPQQFGREDGVEYYELGSSDWQITAIGSGPIEYEWNVDLAVADSGEVALSYFDNNTTDLVFAQSTNGSWELEVVDSDGDVGRFSSLTFDAMGNPHLSYYGTDTGTVRYAVRRDGAWATEDVGALNDVEIAFTGARRITAIDVDSAGVPHIVFTDRAVVVHAVRTDAGWEVANVIEAGDRPLGQLVSFELDGNDSPHIATYEGSAADPSQAEILYLTPG